MDAKRTTAGIPVMAKAAIAVVLAGLLAFALAGTGAQQAAAAGSPTITVTNAATGKVSLKKGATYSLGAKAPGAKVTYKSSKKSVVTVSKKGKLTAKKTGKATITITAKKGSAKATKKVTVKVLSAKKYKAVKKISAKSATNDLIVGMDATIKTTFSPAKASNKNLVYKSSNTTVLTVSAKGAVKAKKAGTAKVTVTSCANKKAKSTVTFTVKAATPAKPDYVDATAVNLSLTEAEIEAGQYVEIFASVEPEDATETDITWSTSDESVATVDGGMVTGTGPGLAVITATAPSGASADCEVHVVAADAAAYDAYLESYAELVTEQDADIDFENLPDDPYATARLIVKDDGSGVDLGGITPQPAEDPLTCGEDVTVLQFASPEEAQLAAESIAVLDGIEWVEPDVYIEAGTQGGNVDWAEDDLGTQAGSYLSWGIEKMGLNVMSDSLRGKKGGVIVAVVDKGVTPEHPLLDSRLIKGYPGESSEETVDISSESHGTRVAGIIAEATND